MTYNFRKLVALGVGIFFILEAADYSDDLREAWHKWVIHYNQTMTDPDKAIGLSFDGYSMSPTMAHKKASWQHDGKQRAAEYQRTNSFHPSSLTPPQ